MSTSAPSTPASTSKARIRCNWTAEERVEWVTQFEQSGTTLSEFCRANDLPEATLSLWRRQLRGPSQGTSDAAPLVEIPLAALSAPAPREETPGIASAVTIRMPGGTTIDVQPGTDPSWLADLLRAMQRARA